MSRISFVFYGISKGKGDSHELFLDSTLNCDHWNITLYLTVGQRLHCTYDKYAGHTVNLIPVKTELVCHNLIEIRPYLITK